MNNRYGCNNCNNPSVGPTGPIGPTHPLISENKKRYKIYTFI